MNIFDESEYTDDAVSEVLNEATSAPSDSESTDSDILDGAVARIEEANLWKALYTKDVFPVGSARESIRSRLNAKLKQIALGEIQVLLGMSETTQSYGPQTSNLFDEREKTVLKSLASLSDTQMSSLMLLVNKVSQKVSGTPAVTPVAFKADVATFAAPTTPQINLNTPSNAKPVNKPAVPKQQKPVQKKNKGQTRPQSVKPIPPASAEELMMKGAIRAGPASVSGDGGIGMNNLMGALVQNLTGGNVVHTDNTPATTGEDTNERF